MIKYCLSILILLILSTEVIAQTNSSACIKSTEGTEFWYGYMESRHHQAGHYLEVTLTSTFACSF